jgi:hypothetical protein
MPCVAGARVRGTKTGVFPTRNPGKLPRWLVGEKQVWTMDTWYGYIQRSCRSGGAVQQQHRILALLGSAWPRSPGALEAHPEEGCWAAGPVGSCLGYHGQLRLIMALIKLACTRVLVQMSISTLGGWPGTSLRQMDGASQS